jgi:thiosulfate/3-mercaptopyruvate sulfurtransferase
MRRQLSALGIHPAQTVILYDEGLSTLLAQCFWALELIGQAEVRVLADGWQAWQASGEETSNQLPSCRSTRYECEPRSCKATAEWITEHGTSAQLLDARGVQEWRAGHIPGAINLDWRDVSCGATSGPSLLPAEEVQARLDEHSLSPERETVTYCRTGNRASFVYFVLRLMGWERVRNYDGSMTDWLLQERPVER